MSISCAGLTVKVKMPIAVCTELSVQAHFTVIAINASITLRTAESTAAVLTHKGHHWTVGGLLKLRPGGAEVVIEHNLLHESDELVLVLIVLDSGAHGELIELRILNWAVGAYGTMLGLGLVEVHVFLGLVELHKHLAVRPNEFDGKPDEGPLVITDTSLRAAAVPATGR
jgi:hypothetical protein